jgi:penicillin-binding protein 1B
VALVAIDPHTGLVKAVAGGRNYGRSQLNRVLANRQPGSIFKPFVYAAAMDTAVEGGRQVLTPSYEVMDEPTTFWWNGQEYRPKNFEGESSNGLVSLRYALTHSLNIPTVAVAEKVGYDAVVQMARRAGLNDRIQPTPAVALGAYDITPFEAVGAYTMFSNSGRYVKPDFLELVRDQTGKELYRHKEQAKQVLDARVAYIVTNILQDVLIRGTAAGARAPPDSTSRPPERPALRTATDGFAGYTSELLCVVWVGFDDSRDLDIEGARIGGAHLDAVHEGCVEVSGIPRYQAVRGARRHCDHRHRPGNRLSRDPRLPRSMRPRSTSPARSPWAPARSMAAG